MTIVVTKALGVARCQGNHCKGKKVPYLESVVFEDHFDV